MKIHYMDCGTMHPRGAELFNPPMSRVPSICLLIEDRDQLVLVDTGFGTQDMQDTSRLGGIRFVLNPIRNNEKPAVRQIKRMGFKPQDVRHIICTHLDRDHSGGLSDFPHAKVHVTQVECEAALHPQGYREKERYRQCHFAHGPQWVTHKAISDKSWFGLECISDLEGLPPEIVLIPLPGHTRGHCGVAINEGDGWLLHCGDTYYFEDELHADMPLPPVHRGFRHMAHCNYRQAMQQLERVRQVWMNHRAVLQIIASHDQFAYKDLSGHAPE